MSYLDDQYIRLVSPQLDKFTQKAGTYNFRCPYCGDSKKHLNKARGYLFRMKNDYVFKCHNCGMGRTFTNFLKDQNVGLYDRYIMERYRDGLTGRNSQTPTPKIKKYDVRVRQPKQINLQKISELNKEHPAREYLVNRKIEDLDYFYYCPKFKDWTNKQKKTFDNLRQDSARIIIPLRDQDGNMFGFQGRSLFPKAKLRYITIMLDESKPKVFGLDRINPEETVYVTEGPFDSTLIRNSIAMCGGDVDLRSFDYRFVYIYDNEPRKRETVAKISKTIGHNASVVIWPKNIKQKDINDMILAGHDVQNVIESNTYNGLTAQLKFNEWKKV